MTTYVTSSAYKKHSVNNNIFKLFICSLLSFLILTTGILGYGGIESYADEQEMNDKFNSYMEEFEVEEANEEEGRTQEDVNNEKVLLMLEDVGSKDSSYYDIKDNQNEIKYLLWRILFKPYINTTYQAVDIDGNNANDSDGVNCKLNDPFNGTVLYHNCDIPTLGTETIQNLVFSRAKTGPSNAEATSAKVAFGIGIPSKLPTNDNLVPLNIANAKNKFTALELFGYNVRYTSYNGEWDWIKLNEGARSLLNSGLGNNLKIASVALKNAFIAGINHAVDQADAWSEKGFGPITKGLFWLGGFVWGVATSGESMFSAFVNTFVDTSELNVFSKYLWYRPQFPETVYNARMLTQEEKSILISESFMKLFEQAGHDMPIIDEGTPGEPQEQLFNASSVLLVGDSLMTGNFSTILGQRLSGATIDAKVGRNASQGVSIVEDQLKRNKGIQYVVVGLAVNAEFTKEQMQRYLDLLKGNEKLVLVAGYVKTGDDIPENSKEFNERALEAAQKSNKNIYEFQRENPNNVRVAQFDKVGMNHPEIFGPDGVHFDMREEGNDLYLNEIMRGLNNWEYAHQQYANEFNDWLKETEDEFAKGEFLKDNPEYNFNAPWNQYVCLDKNGNDIPSSTRDYTFVYKAGTTQLNSYCSEIRPPIQDGYIGNGYLSNVNVPHDTRHIGDNSNFFVELLLGTFFDDFASGALEFSTYFTRVSNFLIDLSFSPIMETLGLHDLVVNVSENFTNGLFFPLAAFVIAITAIYIFFTNVRRMEYVEAIKQLLIASFVFLIAVIILAKPANVLKIADDYPSRAENTIISLLFASSSKDGMCFATGDSESTILGLDGDIKIGKDATVRTMQCEIWRAFTFNPYVIGQWGTTYDNLYESDFNNRNKALVGTPRVDMGAGLYENNWALYQLSLMTTGNATQDNLTKISGGVDPNFYRIVDLQAGPNNAALSDSRYFDTWSGKDSSSRVIVSIMALPTAIMGMITIGFYALIKIEATFAMTILIMLLPIMLLFGLARGWGHTRFKQYVGSLVALAIKRIFSMVALCLMLMFILAVSNSTGNPVLNGILTFGICLLFFMERRTLTEFLNNSVAQASGGLMAQSFMSDPTKFFKDKAPLSVRNMRGKVEAKTRAAAGGFLAGVAHDKNIRSGIKSAKEASKVVGYQTERRQRRTGLGLFSRLDQATSGAIRETDKMIGEAQKDPNTFGHHSVNEKVNNALKEDNEKYAKSLKSKQIEKVKTLHDDAKYNGITGKDEIEKYVNEGLAKEELDDESISRKVKEKYSETNIDFNTYYAKERTNKLRDIDKERKALEAKREKILSRHVRPKDKTNSSRSEAYQKLINKNKDELNSIDKRLEELKLDEEKIANELADTFNKTRRTELSSNNTEAPKTEMSRTINDIRDRRTQAERSRRERIEQKEADRRKETEERKEANRIEAASEKALRETLLKEQIAENEKKIDELHKQREKLNKDFAEFKEKTRQKVADLSKEENISPKEAYEKLKNSIEKDLGVLNARKHNITNDIQDIEDDTRNKKVMSKVTGAKDDVVRNAKNKASYIAERAKKIPGDLKETIREDLRIDNNNIKDATNISKVVIDKTNKVAINTKDNVLNSHTGKVFRRRKNDPTLDDGSIKDGGKKLLTKNNITVLPTLAAAITVDGAKMTGRTIKGAGKTASVIRKKMMSLSDDISIKANDRLARTEREKQEVSQRHEYERRQGRRHTGPGSSFRNGRGL